MVRVKLEDVCERGTSNLKMSDVTDLSGNYPIYGAAGYIGNVDFYHQINPYVAIVKMVQELEEQCYAQLNHRLLEQCNIYCRKKIFFLDIFITL